MDDAQNPVDSEEFIETQFDSQFKYIDFCEVRSGERVPYTSTQCGSGVRQQQHAAFTNEDFSDIEILDTQEMYDEPVTCTSVSVQTEPGSQHILIENNQFQRLMQIVEKIEKWQKALMREFVDLRDNRLNVRYLIDCENVKFTVPFNELDAFANFDKNLAEDREAEKQLKSLFIKQRGQDMKKFVRDNLKAVLTEQLSRQFSFNGRQGNFPAKKFRTIKILKDCTLEKFPNSTEADFNRLVTSYFYYIKDREGKLKKKLKENVNII